MEELVPLVEQPKTGEKPRRFINTPVVDKPAVADFKLRVDNQPPDWSAEFGTEERFQFVKQNIDVDIAMQTRYFMERRGMDQSAAQHEADRKFRIEKRSFTENGHTVEYFYYKMPLTYLMHFSGKEGAVSQPFTEYMNKTYDINPPIIAFAVRSRDHDTKPEGQKLQADFGAVAVTAGWTGNTFNMVDIRTGEEHTMLEDLLESKGRGHGAVFMLPSLHFEGAFNRGNSALDDKELFNSGRAAMFYEDMLSILGINNFIGHSRGGDVAHLLQAKYPSLNCLALMPASDEKPRSHMHNAFKLLQLATWTGQIPLPGADTPDFKTFLGTELTKRLIRDGTLSEDIINQLSADHRTIIRDASGRAINQVIGILGEGYRGDWTELEYAGLPAVISLGKDDALSIYPTVKQFVDRRFDSVRKKLEGQCYPEMMVEVLTELYNDLVIEFDRAGHYAFEEPRVRRQILDKWWNELDRTKITEEDNVAARILKKTLVPIKGNFPPALRIVPRSDLQHNSSLIERVAQIQSEKTSVIRVTVYEYERLRRAGELLGFGSAFTADFAQYDGIAAQLHGWDRDWLVTGRHELQEAAIEAVNSADWQSNQVTRSFEVRRTDLINRLFLPAENLYRSSGRQMSQAVRRQLTAVIYLHMQQDLLVTAIADHKSEQFRSSEAYDPQRSIYQSIVRTFIAGNIETLIARLHLPTPNPMGIEDFEKQLNNWFERLSDVYEQTNRLVRYEDLTRALTGKAVPLLNPSTLEARLERRDPHPIKKDQITSLCLNQLKKSYLADTPQAAESDIYREFLQPGTIRGNAINTFSPELHRLRRFVDYRRVLQLIPAVRAYEAPIGQIENLFQVATDRFTKDIVNHTLTNAHPASMDWETIRGLLTGVDDRLRRALEIPELNSAFMNHLQDSTASFVRKCRKEVAVI